MHTDRSHLLKDFHSEQRWPTAETTISTPCLFVSQQFCDELSDELALDWTITLEVLLKKTSIGSLRPGAETALSTCTVGSIITCTLDEGGRLYEISNTIIH